MNRGISQELRKNKALDVDYISVDERSILDFVRFTMDFSENIKYYNLDYKASDDWKSFFLNDPIFIIARIATIDLDNFKTDAKNITIDSSDTTDKKKDLIEKSLGIMHKVDYWLGLLKKSNYQGVLLTELEMFMKSLGEKVNAANELKKENKVVLNNYKNRLAGLEEKTVIESYKNTLGNLVFIKEKGIKEFKDQIVKSHNHQSHIGLLLAFFKLFQNVQQDINSITKKHLDHYYTDVLQQQRKKLNPYTAIIAVQLNEGVTSLPIDKGTIFDFIIDGERKYTFKTTTKTFINSAKIDDVRTLYKSDLTPYSNKLEEDDFIINIQYDTQIIKNGISTNTLLEKEFESFPKVLGEEQKDKVPEERTMELSEVGIVISSPSLVLEKGKQKIELVFTILPDSYDERTQAMFQTLVSRENVKKEYATANKELVKKSITSKFFKDAFKIYITDVAGWQLVNYSITRFNKEENTLSFIIELKEHEETLIPFDPTIHKGGFESKYPCIKLLLNNDAQYHPYRFLERLTVQDIAITASVSEVTNIRLSNAIGGIDTSIPFTPFGSSPDIGSYIRIQNPLILQKYLSNLQIKLRWSALPLQKGGFETYYKEYPYDIRTESFIAKITQDRHNIRTLKKHDCQQFNLFQTIGDTISSREIPINVDLKNLDFSSEINVSTDPVLSNASPLFIVLTNPDIAFGHQIFPEIYADAALKRSRFRRKQVTLPKQPYIPMLEQLAIDYSNVDKEIMLRKKGANGNDIRLIHLYPLGHIQVFPGPVKSECFLLPKLSHKASICLGLKDVVPGDIMNIGLELTPAIYANTVIKTPTISWKYLSNNDWISLQDLVLEDTTDNLTKSGIVKIKTPKIIQLNNTRLPKGKFWISAIFHEGKEDLNSRIKNICIQAFTVTCDSLDSLTTPSILNSNTVQKIKNEELKGVKNSIGPFNTMSIQPIEKTNNFYTRISERLRHKNRAISNWDIERLILEKFSQIGIVRAYGRNNHSDELLLGSNIQIVVLPAKESENTSDTGKKKIAYTVLNNIKKYITQFVSPYVQVEVCNPVYEQLKVRCSVKFIDFKKRGYLQQALNNELIAYLSPEMNTLSKRNGFDQSFSKIEIINFIESRTYVDFVTEFSVLQLVEVEEVYKIIDTAKYEKIDQLSTISPYALLTSAPEHRIHVINKIKAMHPEEAGIGDFVIESDFVISDNEGKYI